MNITGSADISVLDFGIEYDISGATPKITLTNLSTGSNLAGCSWWWQIVTPSGTYIHNGTSTPPGPDKIGVWAPYVIPDVWPLFNMRVEFSTASPYIATLNVKDSSNNIYTLPKSVLITAPNGNDCEAQNNFGAANVALQVQCNNAKISASDTTDYAYQTLLGSQSSSSWRLVYPMDDGGNIPAPYVVNNAPNVMFPVGFSSEGYQIYLATVATYDMGNSVTIKVAYKFRDNFPVLCNIDLCPLICGIQAMYAKLNHRCGITEENELKDKLLKISILLNMIFMGINEPLCGVDVPGLIDQIKEIGEFGCDCCNTGINKINTIAAGASSCCPVSADIIDKGTGQVPAPCPASYFPAQVLGVDGTTVIGYANDINELVALLNSNTTPSPGWSSYGIAFAQGNCKVGWFLTNPSVIPPIIKVILDTTGRLVKKGTIISPTGCPSGNPYPLKIYDTTGTNVIGVANSISEVVAILNANAGWQAYGVASVKDTCNVAWKLIDPNVIPPNIQTDPGTTTGKIVIVGTTNPPPGCPGGNPYPLRIYNPAGTTIIGIALNINDVVTLLNGYPAWQAFGTASPLDNCNVQWTLINPAVVPPVIPSDTNTGSSGCVNGTNIYTVKMTDVCDTTLPITGTDFAMNAWVDYNNGTGVTYLGIVADINALITALNTNPNKPAPITFAPLGSPDISQIKITNTNCILYSGSPLIYGDHGSTSFLLIGGSHTDMVPGAASTGRGEASALRTQVPLGKIPPGLPNTGVPWMTISFGNVVAFADAKNGKVWYYDFTNPLFPTFIRTITLTNPSGNSFLGTPTIKGISGVTGVSSFFGLYFPTNKNNMTANNHYLVESITGTIWNLNMGDPGSGVIAGFQDQRFEGKCPRCIVQRSGDVPTLYFTQDGSLEADASLASGVAIGKVVTLTLSDFSPTGIAITLDILHTANEDVWAADTDGINTIWFVGASGAIVNYNFISDTVVNRYTGALGINKQIHLRGYARLWQGLLYVCSLDGFDPLSSNQGTLYVVLSTLGGSPPTVQLFIALVSGNTPVSLHAYSITPLGNCLMIAPGNHGVFSGGGGLAIYKTDGSSLGLIQLPANVNIFNVEAIPNVYNYTPNAFV